LLQVARLAHVEHCFVRVVIAVHARHGGQRRDLREQFLGVALRHPHYYRAMLWDVFCKVIDNHGDLGVCWRLAAELAARGDGVRLWADDASALAWMAPQGHERVIVVKWSNPAPL